MPENVLIHILSDEHTDVTQKTLSTEAMSDTTLPGKKTKSEKRKETSFSHFPHVLTTLHLGLTRPLKMQVVGTRPAVSHLRYMKGP